LLGLVKSHDDLFLDRFRNEVKVYEHLVPLVAPKHGIRSAEVFCSTIYPFLKFLLGDDLLAVTKHENVIRRQEVRDTVTSVTTDDMLFDILLRVLGLDEPLQDRAILSHIRILLELNEVFVRTTK